MSGASTKSGGNTLITDVNLSELTSVHEVQQWLYTTSKYVYRSLQSDPTDATLQRISSNIEVLVKSMESRQKPIRMITRIKNSRIFGGRKRRDDDDASAGGDPSESSAKSPLDAQDFRALQSIQDDLKAWSVSHGVVSATASTTSSPVLSRVVADPPPVPQDQSTDPFAEFDFTPKPPSPNAGVPDV